MTENFKDVCLRRYLETYNDCKPESGLGYLLASVMYEKIERERLLNEKIFWLTINPKPGVSLECFQSKVHSFVDRAFVKNCYYSFEIRGKKDNQYHGLHCHILLDKNMSPAQLKDRACSTFKDYVGNKQHIDVRVYSGRFREDKIAYLEGKKWDEDKDQAIAETIAWRIENDIDPCYQKLI